MTTREKHIRNEAYKIVTSNLLTETFNYKEFLEIDIEDYIWTVLRDVCTEDLMALIVGITESIIDSTKALENTKGMYQVFTIVDNELVGLYQNLSKKEAVEKYISEANKYYNYDGDFETEKDVEDYRYSEQYQENQDMANIEYQEQI